MNQESKIVIVEKEVWKEVQIKIDNPQYKRALKDKHSFFKDGKLMGYANEWSDEQEHIPMYHYIKEKVKETVKVKSIRFRKTCAFCESEYWSKRRTSKYCSNTCRSASFRDTKKA